MWSIDILSSCEVLIFYHHEVLIIYSIAQLVNLLTNKIQNKNPARKYAILADFTMFWESESYKNHAEKWCF